MDCNLLDLLPVTTTSLKSQNESEFAQPGKDKNNNNDKNYKLDESTRNGKFKDTASKNGFPCDPELMSQPGCDKVTIYSSRITQETKTFTTVTSDPVCTAASGVVESQSLPTVSSISEPAIRTATTAYQSCVNVTTTTTTITDSKINSTHTSTKSAVIASPRVINKETSSNSSSNNNNNNKSSCHKEFDNSGLQRLNSTDVTSKQDTESGKVKQGTLLTGSNYSGVNSSDYSTQDSYPQTKNAEISKQRPITEQNSKTVVIAPQQESSVPVSSSTPTFDSLVTSSSGALAVAPVPPRTTEGKYSASSSTKTRHAEITSVCSGSECQTTSSPTSEAAVSTATTATTAAAVTATIITEDNEVDCEGNVNNWSGEVGRREDGDPSRESFGETQQKLVIPRGSDESGSLRGPLPAAAAAAEAGQPNSEKSESISNLNNTEEKQQQQQQQQQLPMNKSGEEEAEEKKENKEVLNNVTVLSPLLSSSLLPLPPSQKGGLNQLATTTNTTTTTTTDSAVTRTHSRTDEKSLSLKNVIVSHPKSDPIVSYYNSPFSSSCTPTTSITASSRIAPSSSTPPSSPSSSPSSSSSSLSVGSNEQPLTFSAITSAKNGCVCVKETPPAVQNWDTTTATATANSLNAIIVQEKKTDSVTDTMCGPSKDKIMPNSSGETDGSATGEKNAESINNRSTHTLETTTAKSTASPAMLSISQTLSSLSPKFTATTSATATTTATAMTTKLCQVDFRSTLNVKKLTAPDLDLIQKKDELATAVAAFSNENPSTSQILHESLPSPPPSPPPSPSSTLLPSSPPSVSSTPPTLLNEAQKDVNNVSTIQDNLSKWTDNKTLTKTAAPIKANPNEGLVACGSSNNNSGSDDSAGSQSSPNIGVDSPESFVALPQTCFESSEFEETTEDSNSNNSGHVGVNSTCDLYNNSDCAFNNNISLERRCESLVSENTCDMAYDHMKSSEKVYDNDDNKGTSSKDFHFSSKAYRNIYGSFNAGYNCTFSVPNKEIDQLLETSSNKISSPSSGFVNDLLRCTTAIADDHSYCWSVSKTQESESLLRDAHPCDDEISDSSSLDDIPDQQESLSFLAQNTFSKSSNWKIKNQKTTMSLKGVEKYHKGNGTISSTTSPNGNTFTSNPATKFLVDLPSSGHDRNSKAYRGFDQRSDDERKVNGLLTPVKLMDSNSASITSPKITPLKTPGGLGSRGSLQGSPKVSCFRIGTFGSISNIEWDENSDTSSSVGSLSLSDKSREKFTYCRKVDFTDKPDVQKNLMSLGEHCQKSNLGSSGITRRQSLEANVRIGHILHDHDYCMRTTISPMKCELAKELLSGSKLGSCSSKFSNINPSKSSNSSSNSLAYSSSSSSSSSASYTGITPLRTPSSSSEAKYLRKSRNNSVTKFVDSSEPLQESPLAEKTGDATKLSDPNCDAARSSESKLKITGSFQNDYVYFLNKTTRSRRRISHEILPDKNLQARNYSDIVIPHLTDADIEALKHKRSHSNQTTDTPVWKSSQDASGELEVDNRFINSVLSMENLCSDPAPESVLPGLIDSTVAPDNLAANPEQYLTPEEMDILFNAVKEVDSTNFKTFDEIQKSIDSYNDEIGKELSPTSILPEDQIDPCLADSSDHKEATDKSDVPAITTSQATGIPVTQWSSCNSPADDLVKSEVLTTDNNLLDLENIPISDINPMIGTSSDKFKGPTLSCVSESLPSSDLNTLCANNSNSGLTDVHIPSLEKFDLLNLRLDKSDLFPEPAVTDTSSVSEGTAPWIVTVTMFWNDLPAIVIDSQPFIRLVDIHKQILPAKDTGILKKRCQLLGLKVQNCTEFQRYFLVQYGRAYNSKSTLVISKDDAKILIGYYVNPPSRLPKGEGCDDEPVSPGKRITKTNGSLEGRIKKHGRLIGSRKQSIHKIRNSESQPNKDKIKCEKFEKALDQNLQEEQGKVLSSPSPLSSAPGQLKVKNVSKERLMLSSSMNGKSRLRHKKINFLNLIRGETGTSSSASPSSPAAATVTSSASSSSATTLSMLDSVNTLHMDSNKDAIEKSMVFSMPTKQAKLVVDLKSKAGLKNRISTSHKITGGGEQDLKTSIRDMGSQENSKLKQCNGRVGLSSVARDHTTVRTGNQQKKISRNGKPKPFSTFSAVSSKLPPTSKWKNSRNGHGLGGHGKSSHLKVKLKSKAVAAAAATNRETNKSLITDKMQSLCPALLVYHEDAVPQVDQKPCMQPGKLILSLYSAKNAKCIKCSTCAKVFSVDEFLLHQHLNPNTNSKLVFVSSAQSLRLRDDSNENHQLLWKNFMMKREQFEFEGLEDSRMSHLLRTAGVGMKVGNLPLSSGAPLVDAALNPTNTEHKNKQRSSSTYRVSARKRKQKQFYPIENYDFKNLPGSAGHGKDPPTLDQFGQWRGKARGAEGQSNVGCSPSKKALTLPVSGSCPSYCLNTTGSAGSHGGNSCGGLSKNVVTLKNEPELLSFTALENDEYM